MGQTTQQHCFNNSTHRIYPSMEAVHTMLFVTGTMQSKDSALTANLSLVAPNPFQLKMYIVPSLEPQTTFFPYFINTTEVRSPLWGSDKSSNRRLLMLKTPIVPSPLLINTEFENKFQIKCSISKSVTSHWPVNSEFGWDTFLRWCCYLAVKRILLAWSTVMSLM